MTRILLLGGSGTVGQRIARCLVATGVEVVATHRSAEQAPAIASTGAVPVAFDPNEPASPALVRRPDVLVSLVPLSSGLGGRLAEVAHDVGAPRVVVMSSAAVYTKLSAPTKERRLEGERALRSVDSSTIVLRPTMIYGDRDDGNISRLLRVAHRVPVLPVPGGGGSLVQPVHLDDVAATVAWAVASSSEETFDLGGPQAVRFDELIALASASLGRRVRTLPVPLGPTRSLVSAYERAVRRPRLRAEQIDRLAEDKTVDNAPLLAASGLRQTDLVVGLRRLGVDLGLTRGSAVRGPFEADGSVERRRDLT